MKRKKNLVVLVLVGVFIGMGFGSALASGHALPSAEGKAVYDYLTNVSPYQNWSLFPGTEKLYEGQHPHGALLTTYVSPDVLKAIHDRKGKVPNGGFIVKENYMPDGKFDALTIMYRVKGYNPEAGDWFWAKYGAEGNIDAAGKVDGCIGCHTSVIQNDWVFTGPLK